MPHRDVGSSARTSRTTIATGTSVRHQAADSGTSMWNQGINTGCSVPSQDAARSCNTFPRGMFTATRETKNAQRSCQRGCGGLGVWDSDLLGRTEFQDPGVTCRVVRWCSLGRRSSARRTSLRRSHVLYGTGELAIVASPEWASRRKVSQRDIQLWFAFANQDGLKSRISQLSS